MAGANAGVVTHGLLGAQHSLEGNGITLRFADVQGAEDERQLVEGNSLAGESQVWTGQFLWQSGGELSKFVVGKGADYWRGKRALELGCGCGMVGLSAAAMGANHVLLTDQVIAGAVANTKANPSVACRVACRRLDWGDEAMIREAGKFDVILGSDILQEGGDIVGSHNILGDTIAELSGPSTEVFLCGPIGNPAKVAPFFSLMKEHGFSSRVVQPPSGFDPIAVIRLARTT
jgi:predicted nicotinamide N-methyase